MRTKKSYYTTLTLVIAIIVFINFLSADFFARLDLTENGRYTLSKATKDIISNLDEPITIRAYFTENLPPNIAQTRKDFRDMLIEYSNRSDNNVVYEFINPNESQKVEQEANQAGISPVMINVREKDQMKQQKAYLGAIVQKGNQQEVIPFLQPGEVMEYALTTSIKKLSVQNKPSIGLIQGHGEPGVQGMQQAGFELGVLYNFEDHVMTDTTVIPSKFRTIAIISPQDTIPQSHFVQIDNFIRQGGRILVGIDRVNGDLQNAYGSSMSTGLESWLAAKGINVENKFLIDASCAAVNVQQQQGSFRFNTQIQFPYLPVINTFSDHAITKGLEGVLLPFASPLTFSGDSSVQFTPIAFSSAKSGTAPVPAYFDIQKQWQESDFPLEELIVGATLEGTISGNPASKMVVIGDGDFPINSRSGGQGQPLQRDNVSLFVNSIDWLSDDTGLIELRTKGVTFRPIDQIADGTKTLLKYMNFLLPIILVIAYGLIRMQIKRSLRFKRMEMSYE
jgi:gliding-associated putative ABC transporter substrate-binding component GldG